VSGHLHAVNYLRNFPIGREPYLQAKVDEWAIRRPKYRGSNEMLLDPEILNNPALKKLADQLRFQLRQMLRQSGSSPRMLDAGRELFTVSSAGPDLWETRSASDAIAFNRLAKRITIFVRNRRKFLERFEAGVDPSDPITALFIEMINFEKRIGDQYVARMNFELQLYQTSSEQNVERVRLMLEANDDLMRRLSPVQKRMLQIAAPPQNGDDDDNDEDEE